MYNVRTKVPSCVVSVVPDAANKLEKFKRQIENELYAAGRYSENDFKVRNGSLITALAFLEVYTAAASALYAETSQRKSQTELDLERLKDVDPVVEILGRNKFKLSMAEKLFMGLISMLPGLSLGQFLLLVIKVPALATLFGLTVAYLYTSKATDALFAAYLSHYVAVACKSQPIAVWPKILAYLAIDTVVSCLGLLHAAITGDFDIIQCLIPIGSLAMSVLLVLSISQSAMRYKEPIIYAIREEYRSTSRLAIAYWKDVENQLKQLKKEVNSLSRREKELDRFLEQATKELLKLKVEIQGDAHVKRSAEPSNLLPDGLRIPEGEVYAFDIGTPRDINSYSALSANGYQLPSKLGAAPAEDVIETTDEVTDEPNDPDINPHKPAPFV
jgi:hypothetical protein